MIIAPNSLEARQIKRVLVNGKPIECVFLIDTKKQKVKFHPRPLRVHKYGKRLLSKTIYGEIKVINK